MSKPKVIIYTDGSCSPNPGPGGWGVILIAADGREREAKGGDPDTTNNRMELTAAIKGLRALKVPCVVALYTDSQYVRMGITDWLPKWIAKGWKTRTKAPVKNQDLWQALQAEIQNHEVTWQWVRGHTGNVYNERVDRLAAQARLEVTDLKPSIE